MTDDNEAMDGEVRLSQEIKAAWTTALKLYGCVECARLDLRQRIALMARAASWEVMGDEDQPREVGPDGTRLKCQSCQAPAPPGAVRFFKDGTDEFL